MRIIEISYHEKGTGWTIENMRFDQFNLLVGISGVGKTRILEAIRTMAEIADGKSFAGIKWSIIFDIEGTLYYWSGEFEDAPDCKLLEEVIAVDGKTYIDRTEPAGESILSLVLEDGILTDILLSFNEFLITRTSLLEHTVITGDFIAGMVEQYQSGSYKLLKVASIAEIELLAIAEKVDTPLFESFKKDLKKLLPHIEDITFEENRNEKGDTSLYLAIKETNTGWFPAAALSDGMLKTINLLLSIFFAPKKSVLLIDGLENNLGINSMEGITGMISTNPDIQCIITSHHPYVINTIDIKHWKIVRRDGPKVFLSTSEELKLGDDREDAFKRLLNTEVYSKGIK